MQFKDPVTAFKNVSKNQNNLCFLHSGKRGKSYLAFNPIDKYSGEDLQNFQKFLKKNKGNLLMGYLSYDLSYELQNLKQKAKNDLKLPKIYFLAFKNWDIYKTSHFKKNLKLAANHSAKKFKSSISKSQYKTAFKKIKNYLQKGEIYQINLTHRLEARTKQNPRDLFLKVIKNNSVDFLAYIEGDGFEILSASPERFIKIENNQIETCPIKGTRPRGKTDAEDLKMENELLKSPKEAAELNMITDLLRNDLNKVCQAGSVKVKGHRLIQKCPTVWHTYSKITGKLKTKPIDALISMFPGGSITGCPKKRAMEIIDELEPNTRGIYTGNVGYISPDQKSLDFNITIRTLIKKGQKVYLQVGGGIVFDSKLEQEYKETWAKAASFLSIL